LFALSMIVITPVESLKGQWAFNWLTLERS
jgi:hypothetical protein